MGTRKASAFVATVVTVVSCGVFVAAAFASTYAHHVEIYAGNHYAGTPFVAGVNTVSAASYGTAYSGTWINNTTGTGGTRVSTDLYCNTPGCTALIAWTGAQPNGYGTAENHGNASPSYFEGVIN